MATCWEPSSKAGSTPRVTCRDPAHPFKAFTEELVAKLVALARWTPKLGKAKREVSGRGRRRWRDERRAPQQPAHPNVGRTIIGPSSDPTNLPRGLPPSNGRERASAASALVQDGSRAHDIHPLLFSRLRNIEYLFATRRNKSAPTG